MALFDNINSRYTKSMEHGGSYERDAAIGGYDRKELRGLNKQARSGTLTQRERARLRFLKDERGDRRKRGLLTGLGGAAAALGGLAAAGKLGGGEGGSALMDAIKTRIDDKQKARADELGEKGEGSMEGLSPLEAQEMLTDSPRGLMESGPGIGEAPVSSNMQIPEGLPFQERSEGGPPVRGGMAPMAPGAEGRSDTPSSYVQEALLEMAREDASRVSSENPATGPVRRDIEFAPADRVTEPLAGNEERRFRGAPPLTFGDEDYGDVLTEKGFRSSDINIDPEGLAKDPVTAKEALGDINRLRKELGLDPVERLSEETLQETKAIRDHMERKNQGSGISMPRGPSAAQPQGPRDLVDQIFNRYR